MPKCAMIACVLAFDGNSLVERYPIAARVLLLAAIFGSGCFEAFVLKLKNLSVLNVVYLPRRAYGLDCVLVDDSFNRERCGGVRFRSDPVDRLLSKVEV